MQELILQPETSIVLEPSESLGAGEEPLRILCKQMGLSISTFNNHETMLWESMKRSTGYQTAIYQRGDESRTVSIVPESPNTNAFGFTESGKLTTTTRIFKIAKADLLGWLPKAGDTLTYQDKTYTFSKTAADSLYQDIGTHGVMIQIFVTDYRG